MVIVDFNILHVLRDIERMAVFMKNLLQFAAILNHKGQIILYNFNRFSMDVVGREGFTMSGRLIFFDSHDNAGSRIGE